MKEKNGFCLQENDKRWLKTREGAVKVEKKLFCKYLSKDWTKKEQLVKAKSRRIFCWEERYLHGLKCVPVACLFVIMG